MQLSLMCLIKDLPLQNAVFFIDCFWNDSQIFAEIYCGFLWCGIFQHPLDVMNHQDVLLYPCENQCRNKVLNFLILFLCKKSWNSSFSHCIKNKFSVNDTHREKLYFTQFSIRMAAWLLLTFYICLHNQLSSIYSSITY